MVLYFFNRSNNSKYFYSFAQTIFDTFQYINMAHKNLLKHTVRMIISKVEHFITPSFNEIDLVILLSQQIHFIIIDK
jgi:hypothetical protein